MCRKSFRKPRSSNGKKSPQKTQKFTPTKKTPVLKLADLPTGTTNDVVVTFNGQPIPHNKAILARKSKFFLAAFNVNWRENTAADMTLEYPVSLELVYAIMNYFSTDKIDLTRENVMDVYPLASYLEIADLMNRCKNVMKITLNFDILPTLRAFANDNYLVEISKYIDELIETRFKFLAAGSEFLSWSYEDMKYATSLDSIKTPCESKILLFVAKWLNHDFQNRAQYMEPLLYQVRFSYLTKTKVEVALRKFYLDNKQIYLTANKMMVDCSQQSTVTHKPRVYNKGIYIYERCKRTDDKLQRYCPYYNEIQELSSPKFNRKRRAMVTLGEKIYLIGGESGKEAHNDVECYDSNTDTWSRVASLLHARHSHVSCAFGGKIYVFGGFDSHSREGPRLMSEVYCPESDSWQPLQNDRCQGGPLNVVVHDDTIYLLPKPIWNQTNEGVQTFKPETNEWDKGNMQNNCFESSAMFGDILFQFEELDCRYVVHDMRTKNSAHGRLTLGVSEDHWQHMQPDYCAYKYITYGRRMYVIAEANGNPNFNSQHSKILSFDPRMYLTSDAMSCRGVTGPYEVCGYTSTSRKYIQEIQVVAI